MKTKVQRWGNSMGVRIPKVFAQEAKLQDGDVVDVRLRKGQLVIVPAHSGCTLGNLLSKITPENIHSEVATGGKRGREAW